MTSFMLNETQNGSVFLLPHYDDEIGCLTALRFFGTKSQNLIIYLTRGDRRFIGRFDSRSQNFRQRRDESKNLRQALGFNTKHFTVVHLGKELRISDSKLTENASVVADSVQKIIEIWMSQKNLREIYVITPDFEGGHPDHDAAAVIGQIISRSELFFKLNIKPICLGFPMYRLSKYLYFPTLFRLWKHKQGETTFVLPIDFNVRKILIKLLFIFQSQRGTIVQLYPGLISAYWFRRIQVYRILESINFNLIKKEIGFLYETRNRENSAEWLDVINARFVNNKVIE